MAWKLPGKNWKKRWARARRNVLDRDGWRCLNCGRAGRLEVDHVIALRNGGEPWDMGNLQTLCRAPCHFAKTAAENRKTLTPERGALAALVSELTE